MHKRPRNDGSSKQCEKKGPVWWQHKNMKPLQGTRHATSVWQETCVSLGIGPVLRATQ